MRQRPHEAPPPRALQNTFILVQLETAARPHRGAGGETVTPEGSTRNLHTYVHVCTQTLPVVRNNKRSALQRAQGIIHI